MSEEFDFDTKLLKCNPHFDLLRAADDLGFDLEESITTNFSDIAQTILLNYSKIRKGYIIRDLKLFRMGVHTMKGFFG